MRRPLRALLLVLACGLLAACERGPDEAQLARDLQAQLDRSFGAGLLELAGLRRTGSAPQANEDGAEASAIVYFAAEIALSRDHDFTAWGGPGAGTLADLLGATQEGLRGIDQGGNAAGDRFQVYGSAGYRLREGRWQPRPQARPQPSTPVAFDNVAAPNRALSLLGSIQALLDSAEIDISGPEGAVVTYELETAWTNIQRRLDRIRSLYGFASGPVRGEYWRVGRAYARFMGQRGVRVANLETRGSVENARLLARGEADLALMQSDIAHLALTGEGPFAGQRPMEDLRALASLYPEPVHVIVMADSGIRSIRDLAGRSLDLGPLGSGSRSNAWGILRAHGLDSASLESYETRALPEALQALARGETAAVFTTIGVPARVIRDFLALYDARLIGFDGEAIPRLLQEMPGLVPFTISAHSYLGQSEPVATLAATTLLVADRSMPEGEVVAVLTATFEEMDFLSLGSFQGARISMKTAREGLSLPLHPGADNYYSGEGSRHEAGPQGPSSVGPGDAEPVAPALPEGDDEAPQP